MLRFERSDANVPEMMMDLDLHGGKESKRASMLYQVLPAIVQSRIPSFRRSISDYRRQGLHGKSRSLTEMSRPSTPPPSYTLRPGTGSSTPISQVSGSSDSVFDDMHGNTDMESTASGPPPQTPTYETSTGISWQHARHGVQMLTQAHRQSSAPPNENDDTMTLIMRAQYVQSVTIFLRSLPNNLTPAERLSILAAMPESVPGAHVLPTQTLILARQAGADVPQSSDGGLVWRTSAWIVFKLLLIIQFLLPYLGQVFRKAAEIDNERQISRRMFNTSVTTANYVGREGLRVSQAMLSMNNGAIYNAAVYYAGQVAGGMQEGVRNALRP